MKIFILFTVFTELCLIELCLAQNFFRTPIIISGFRGFGGVSGLRIRTGIRNEYPMFGNPLTNLGGFRSTPFLFRPQIFRTSGFRRRIGVFRAPPHMLFANRGFTALEYPGMGLRDGSAINFGGLRGYPELNLNEVKRGSARRAYSGYKEADYENTDQNYDKHLDKKNRSLDKSYLKNGIYSHDRGHGFVKSWSWDKNYSKNRAEERLNEGVDELEASDQGALVAGTSSQHEQENNLSTTDSDNTK